MKHQYARLLLWLIRPAVDAAIAESGKPGGQLWRMRNHCGIALPDRVVIGDVARRDSGAFWFRVAKSVSREKGTA
ncbi:hypothetical protein [Burkholderia stagnalis]|uniref:hypothetical protein n=1 Tax=Burkholderia stagnalis TaxID=1503054 RepID=UPI0012DAA540|nr:hypothetical protein [Burkholderia stagnalis]